MKALMMIAALGFGGLSHSVAQADESQQRSATEASASEATAQGLTEPAVKLDLSIGNVMYILTPEQVELALGTDTSRLSGARSPMDEQLEQVEVRATREQHGDLLMTPIPLGLASIAWAVRNPAEAWRIFAPVQMG